MKNNEIAYTEVDTILSLMDEKYINKIPKNLRGIFKEEKSFDYKPNIDPKKSLNEQNLQRETLVILAILSLNYWCESEEEKQKLIKAYSENEKKNETEIKEKYNPDYIFKNNIMLNREKTENQKEIQMVEYKEGFLKKLWNKLEKFFWKQLKN